MRLSDVLESLPNHFYAPDRWSPVEQCEVPEPPGRFTQSGPDLQESDADRTGSTLRGAHSQLEQDASVADNTLQVLGFPRQNPKSHDRVEKFSRQAS
jgi:hypothetical protein